MYFDWAWGRAGLTKTSRRFLVAAVAVAVGGGAYFCIQSHQRTAPSDDRADANRNVAPETKASAAGDPRNEDLNPTRVDRPTSPADPGLTVTPSAPDTEEVAGSEVPAASSEETGFSESLTTAPAVPVGAPPGQLIVGGEPTTLFMGSLEVDDWSEELDVTVVPGGTVEVRGVKAGAGKLHAGDRSFSFNVLEEAPVPEDAADLPVPDGALIDLLVGDEYRVLQTGANTWSIPEGSEFIDLRVASGGDQREYVIKTLAPGRVVIELDGVRLVLMIRTR